MTDPDTENYLNSPLPGCEPALPATSGRALADATDPEAEPFPLSDAGEGC